MSGTVPGTTSGALSFHRGETGPLQRKCDVPSTDLASGDSSVHRFGVQGGKAAEEEPRSRSDAPACEPGKRQAIRCSPRNRARWNHLRAILKSTAFSRCSRPGARPRRWTPIAATSQHSRPGSTGRSAESRQSSSSSTSQSYAPQDCRRRPSRDVSPRSARSSGTRPCSAYAPTIQRPSSTFRDAGARFRAHSPRRKRSGSSKRPTERRRARCATAL